MNRILKKILTFFTTQIMSTGELGQPMLASISHKEVLHGHLERGDGMVSGDEGKMIEGFVEKAPTRDRNFSCLLQNSYFLAAG
jgi:hypothetical protein